jgi:hypothetical protein
MFNRMRGVWSARKGKMARGDLVFNYYEGCVRSVQIPNLTNKTFLNSPYIFQVLKTWRVCSEQECFLLQEGT